MYTIPGVSQHFVNVHGVRMAYRKAGAGPPVVLLHGLAASSLTWSANIQALAERHTVYALDYPGHGDSDHLAVDYGTDPGVKVFRRFLERIGEPKAALVGNSLGGLIALRYALDYPGYVTHLVLVDSAGLGTELSWALRLASLPLVGEVLLSGAFITAKGLSKRLFEAPERVDPQLLKALHHARTVQMGSHIMLAMARTGTTLFGLKDHHNLLPRLGELQVPLLVVWGEQDRVLPVHHAHAVAERYPHAQVKVFPDVGHWPHMEEADAFNRLVLGFLGS